MSDDRWWNATVFVAASTLPTLRDVFGHPAGGPRALLEAPGQLAPVVDWPRGRHDGAPWRALTVKSVGDPSGPERQGAGALGDRAAKNFAFERAQLYGLALLRDVPFADIASVSTRTGPAGVSPRDVFSALAEITAGAAGPVALFGFGGVAASGPILSPFLERPDYLRGQDRGAPALWGPDGRLGITTPSDLASLACGSHRLAPFRAAHQFLGGEGVARTALVGAAPQGGDRLEPLLRQAAAGAMRAARRRHRARPHPSPAQLEALIEATDAAPGPSTASREIVEALRDTLGRTRLRDWWRAEAAVPEAPARPAHPAAVLVAAAAAGACSTVLKAAFTSVEDAPDWTDRAFPGSGPVAAKDTPTLAGALDRLAANLALGHAVAGRGFVADTRRGLLLGERAALVALGRSLRDGGAPARLRWRSLDGARMVLQARRGASGTLTVALAPPD